MQNQIPEHRVIMELVDRQESMVQSAKRIVKDYELFYRNNSIGLTLKCITVIDNYIDDSGFIQDIEKHHVKVTNTETGKVVYENETIDDQPKFYPAFQALQDQGLFPEEVKCYYARY